MKKWKLFGLVLSLLINIGSIQAAIVLVDFENDSVTGGTLVLTAAGTGSTSSFTSDRFDDLTSAPFQIQSIPGVGTVGITATGLLTSLNILGGGLADGSTSYNTAGEGTSFTFDHDVTITGLDWTGFTSVDSVELFNNGVSLGVFTDGTVSGGISFANTNAVTMNVNILAGTSFSLVYQGGAFLLGDMTFTAVPEPSTYVLFGLGLGTLLILRRRKATPAPVPVRISKS